MFIMVNQTLKLYALTKVGTIMILLKQDILTCIGTGDTPPPPSPPTHIFFGNANFL